ncbi:MAG: RAD55 family ATPase [Candidatus Hodarchaeales archaeon]
MNRDLIPIGIPVIDDFIYGFPKDSIILILGDPGSGFITFLHQLLVMRGKKGVKVIYTSLDKAKNEIEDELNIFDWDMAKLPWFFNDFCPSSRNEHSKTIQWDQDALSLVSHKVFKRIKEFKDDPTIKVFDSCVSTLTYMLIQSSTKAVLRFINEYSNRIKGSNGWHFLTMVKGVHGQEVENLFSHYSDVVLEFAMRLNTETRLYERVLGIKKLPGVDARAFPIEYDKTGIRPITTSKIQ